MGTCGSHIFRLALLGLGMCLAKEPPSYPIQSIKATAWVPEWEARNLGSKRPHRHQDMWPVSYKGPF